MIPEHSPSRTTENGVRYRIAACRQRLRNSRITHRASNNSQMDPAAERARISVPVVEQLASAEIIVLPGFAGPAPQPVLATKELEEVGIT